jgi:hypothetical protein
MGKENRKHADGKYHIKGKMYDLLVGSRAQVMHETAYKTTGGLVMSDLKYNKNRDIVSRKKSMTAKNDKRLEKAGYKPKKGVFVLMRKSMRKMPTKPKKNKTVSKKKKN